VSELLDLVSPYLKRVKTSGPENIMAICPFHRKADGSEERNGSFSMNKYNGLWYCHSCHESGTIRSFLSRVGVSDYAIKEWGPVIESAAKAMPPGREPLKPIAATGEILEESFLGLFDAIPKEILNDPEHLADFDPELLRRFDIGFDSFHQRITYPLRDLQGQLIGISGRSLGKGARYKLYDKEYEHWGLRARGTEKRVIIWNAHQVEAQLAITTDPSSQYLVIVEGFKGCMKVVQAGIENTIALLSSHPTEEQIDWIRRMDVPLYLMFDNDEAGLLGTLAAGNALPRGLHSVNVVSYDALQPSALQPPEVLDAILTAEPFGSWFHQAMWKHSDINNL
jgi:DNA primase